MIRPFIEPHQAPGGLVFHAYTWPADAEPMMFTFADLPDGDPVALWDRAAALLLDLVMAGVPVMLVAYNGDTGQLIARADENGNSKLWVDGSF
jgi:hypothetical protein